MIIRLSELRARAAEVKDGYLDEFMSVGTLDGEFLRVARSDYLRLREKYSGIGDAVAVFTKPVARLIDSALGTDLANCNGCKGRQKWLNELTT